MDEVEKQNDMKNFVSNLSEFKGGGTGCDDDVGTKRNIDTFPTLLKAVNLISFPLSI